MRKGRQQFLSQFTRLEGAGKAMPPTDPTARATFERCKLRHESTERAAQYVRLHSDLLRLRREDSTIALQADAGLDGATLGERALLVRFFGPAGDDRLLVINLGSDLDLVAWSEPLVAPPDERVLEDIVVERRSILWRERHAAVAGRPLACSGPVRAAARPHV